MALEARFGQQRAAEATVHRFAELRGPFVVAAETTRMPMLFTNAGAPGHPIVFVNEAFLRLTGFLEHEVLGQRFDFLMVRGAEAEALMQLRTAFEGGRDLETALQFCRKDGTVFWASTFVSPVRDEQGVIVQHFASFAEMAEPDGLRSDSGDTAGRPPIASYP